MRYLIFFLCAFSMIDGVCQTELTAEEIFNLLPSKIPGYHKLESFRSKKMKMGTLTYTLFEKKFKKKEKSIQLLLFDYTQAEIMYSQATKNWNTITTVDNDSVKMMPIQVESFSGIQSFRKKTGKSQVSLGINNRFYLNVSGENISLPELVSIVNMIPLSKLPLTAKRQ